MQQEFHLLGIGYYRPAAQRRHNAQYRGRALSGLGADWGQIVGDVLKAAGEEEAARNNAKAARENAKAVADSNQTQIALLKEQEKFASMKKTASGIAGNPLVLGGAAVALGGILFILVRRRRRKARK